MSYVDHVSDLLPAYALNCLDSHEQLQVEEHLAICSICESELAAYQAVVAELPRAVHESAPPPAVKQRILKQVQSKTSTHSVQSNRSWLAVFLSNFKLGSPLLSAASLVVIILLAAGNLFLLQNMNRQNRQSFGTIAMQGTGPTNQAKGLIVVSPDGEHGALIVDGLTPLDASHQYQLWLIQDGQRTSGGVFSVDTEGYGVLWVPAPEPLIQYTSFGVTIEPAGGSPGPTGDKVLGGQF